jgi:hypothetical protein
VGPRVLQPPWHKQHSIEWGTGAIEPLLTSDPLLCSSPGLTLLSQTALGPAAATLGPLLGKLNVGALLPRCSASALAALPVGGNCL